MMNKFFFYKMSAYHIHFETNKHIHSVQCYSHSASLSPQDHLYIHDGLTP